MEKEIILICGFPCSGKTTLVREYVDQGYFRLNRDNLGGSLSHIAQKVKELLDEGTTKIVLDNTYGTKKSRKEVIDIAELYDIPIRCVWLKTRIEDAQVNSCIRIIRNYKRLLPPKEIHQYRDSDAIPAVALFEYRKKFEKPTISESFYDVTEVNFTRTWPDDYTNRAIILDYDGTLRTTISNDIYPTRTSDIRILPNRAEVLRRYRDNGYLLLGVSNQSGVDKGTFLKSTVDQCFVKTNELLNLEIDYMYCPHHSFPISCYCRKPMPGLGVHFIEKYKLDPKQCIMVGDMTSDKTFAARSGFSYQHPDQFFQR